MDLCLIRTTQKQEKKAIAINSSAKPTKCTSQSAFHSVSATFQSGKGSGSASGSVPWAVDGISAVLCELINAFVVSGFADILVHSSRGVELQYITTSVIKMPLSSFGNSLSPSKAMLIPAALQSWFFRIQTGLQMIRFLFSSLSKSAFVPISSRGFCDAKQRL